jgi:methionyl aminopeptidase
MDLPMRNEPCWCGSGNKYKKCHLELDSQLEDLRSQGIPVPLRKLLKTEEQINGIRKACQLSKEILDEVGKCIRPGLSTAEIDRLVYQLTRDSGAQPATLNYKGFPASCCTSINEVVCHGIPGKQVLMEGDIINVDVTTILNGYYGDTSRMFFAGAPSEEARQLVKVARECMELGIQQVKPFNRTGDIGAAIEAHAAGFGYSVVRDYGGHGVGLEFHEGLFIPHYGEKGSGVVLVPNLVFTVEPMINVGDFRCKLLEDGWTAVTADGSLTAQWEHTVVVTKTGVEILTA